MTIAATPEHDVEPETTKRRRRSAPAVAVAAAAAASLVGVTWYVASIRAEPSAADFEACNDAIGEFVAINESVIAEFDTLDVSDPSGMGRSADNFGGYAAAAGDLDTSACDTIAPSFAPTVEKSAEGWELMQVSLIAASAGEWDSASDFSDQAEAAMNDAATLFEQVTIEVEQAVAE